LSNISKIDAIQRIKEKNRDRKQINWFITRLFKTKMISIPNAHTTTTATSTLVKEDIKVKAMIRS